MTKSLTRETDADQALLLRMDSAFDSTDNMKVCVTKGVDFVIKRNPRKETAEDWLANMGA